MLRGEGEGMYLSWDPGCNRFEFWFWLSQVENNPEGVGNRGAGGVFFKAESFLFGMKCVIRDFVYMSLSLVL